jgi:hypothetical protein
LRLWLDLFLRRHGWPAVAGALAGALALGIAIEVALPMLEGAMAGSVVAAPMPDPPAVDGNSGRLQKFRSALPDGRTLPELIAAVTRAASANGLAPARADYTTESNPAGGYTACHIQFQVQGSYPAMRRFVDALLVEMPSAGLEDITLRRDNVAGGDITATLKLVLYVTDVVERSRP